MGVKYNDQNTQEQISTLFEEQQTKQELKEISFHDFYTYRPEYKALFYQLASKQGHKVGLKEVQKFPEENSKENHHEFLIALEDVEGVKSRIDIKNLTLFLTKRPTLRSQYRKQILVDIQECNRNFGYYDKMTQQCYTYYRLSKVCVKISQNQDSLKWELNNTWGTYGCNGQDKSVEDYEQIKLIDNNEIDFYFPLNHTITINIRNGKDPYLVASVLTVNTFNFGISSRDMLVLGIAFTVIGMLAVVQPLVYLIKIRRDINKVDYFKEKEAPKKSNYLSYTDDQPDSITESGVYKFQPSVPRNKSSRPQQEGLEDEENNFEGTQEFNKNNYV